MKRSVICALALGLAAATAHAQPMAAMKGMPLPADDLSPGTVSVRVVAGNIASPVSGVAVTLTVNGTPREARTDAEGRAFFKDLPVGATVQAKITGEDGKDVPSEQFQIPGDKGMKLMLSNRPIEGGMGGAPFAGGAGMPEPRKLSGIPRPEQNYQPGTYAVRVTYDDLKEKDPPVGLQVALVGYAADGSVSLQTAATDKSGHAMFGGLDRSGATAYFALALVPRGTLTDRLAAQPMTMAPQVGATVALSSEKRTSTALAIDDTGDDGAAPGTVRVALLGAPDAASEVRLIDVATHAQLGKTTTHPGPPDLTQIQGSAPFEAKPDMPAGTLDVEVRGGPDNASDQPMSGVGVRLVPESVTDPSAAPADAPSATTDDSGKAHVVTPKPGRVRALIKIHDTEIPTQAFDLSKTGGVVQVQAQWPSQGGPEATLQIVPRPGQVVYAEAISRGETYRSKPFQLMEGRGAYVSVAVLPRIMFSFSWTSHIDDEFLAVQGRFDVYNNSWIPYAGNDSDGILIPLPEGFKGAILADQDQTDVGIAQGEGFRIVRPLAPGMRRFIGGFSVPVEDGRVSWHLDLPLGAYQSGLELQEVPGMSVRLPAGVHAQTAKDERGTWRVISPITILPKQSMVMTITGLPSPPGWRLWAPRVLGILVVAMLLGGIGFALARARTGAASEPSSTAQRRQQLLDELVALEQQGEAGTRRDAILDELERLWDRGRG